MASDGCGKKVFSVVPERRFNICGQVYDGRVYLCKDCKPVVSKPKRVKRFDWDRFDRIMDGPNDPYTDELL